VDLFALVQLVLALQEMSVVGNFLSMTLVVLLEAHFLLSVVTSGAEDDDAGSLDANISVEASNVISEESDRGGDHVGTEKGGGVDEELLGVVEAVETEDHGGNSLDDELGVRGGEVAEEESPAE